MIRILIITTIVFFSATAYSQFKISGTVTDQDGKPIEGAKVVATSHSSAFTNSEGVYEFGIEKGKYQLHVNHDDYQMATKFAVVNKDVIVDFVVESASAMLETVTIKAVKLRPEIPMSYSEMNSEEISERNLGQDFPILLNYMPSVVTTSDAGAGVGYTGMRVRGSDATRTNVIINGVPYNDSESQGTFWVDLPDFASSVENIQLSRGVGSSTNGSGAFGANLSLTTNSIDAKPYAEISNYGGSFNTRKHNLKFNTGLLNKHFQINGSLSRIKSDGYVDRASSDLNSYFLQAGFINSRTQVKFLTFGGFEETYQSWYGVDSTMLANNRTENLAGAYTDEDGNVQYHQDQVDHYNQDHYQLIVNRLLSDRFTVNLTSHYTWGRGYFEEFKEDDALSDYGIANVTIDTTSVTTSDLIRRRWLDNDFYGAIASINYQYGGWTSNLGASYNEYKGDHFGEVIWAKFASNSTLGDRYYDNFGNKTESNIFWKAEHKFLSSLTLFADLQMRNIDYNADGIYSEDIEDSFSFFNPKLGLSHARNGHVVFASYARANREPSRSDYQNGNPVPEQLDDIEVGWRLLRKGNTINVNGFYMLYKDQLVLTGQLDQNGMGIRSNVGESFRAGVEFDASIAISEKLSISPNFSLSSNKIKDVYTIGDDGLLVLLGDKKIGYSPEIVAGNRISYSPIENLSFSLFSKYVGEQFMSNIEAPQSLLDAYFVSDFLVKYAIAPKSGLRAVELSLLVNNIFDEEYSSNGYWFPGYTGYFPQAGMNFLTGVSLKI